MATGEAGTDRPDRTRARLKAGAVVCGLVATVLALLTPFLPVNHDVTTLKWPTAHGTRPVSAPLATYSPLWLDVTVPCAAARSLDARTVPAATLVSTNAPASEYGKLTGLTLQVHSGHMILLSRGQQLGNAPLADGPCSVHVRADSAGTVAELDGEPFAHAAGDLRPQLTGIHSDLDARADDVRGVSVQARVDDRYQSRPTAGKLVVIGLAVLAFVGALVALRRFDAHAARRPRRLAQPGWWKPTLRDLAVLGTLLVWWLIGAMTADDGYFLTMARVRDELGYVSDFYRWFSVAVAPMGWFVEVYSWWVRISTATPWVRLPALAMGVASWLLISREVLPRLGQQVRRSNAAGWAAGAVFLAFWLPYNNGLRPEPVVVVFALLALCAVERTVASGRLFPAGLGLVGAALAVAANPHGVVAVLPFAAAAKPLARLIRDRAREFGWLPVLAPLSACGFVILTLAFGDQTWQSVMDSMELRKELGPDQKWFEELHRYNLLFGLSWDGSMTRRFPVLLVLLCLALCVVVLLRRGQIRGAALGPSRRLLAIAGLSFVVLALTPTKHTHHFGVFAATGGALAALTALATSSTVLRSRRNRTVFFAGLMVILAFAATGTNAWWYVSGWGVPWFDKPPSIKGYTAATFFLVIAGIALLVALIEHLRLDETTRHSPTEERGRALRLGTAPLSIVCALLVVGEVAALAKVIQEQSGSYSLGQDNVRQLTGSSCGLSDYVYVETEPLAGVLAPAPGQPKIAAPGSRAPKRNGQRPDPSAYLAPVADGFQRPGLPPGDGSHPGEPDWTPPHQFGGDRAPVWGSYEPAGTSTGELRTPWYELPERATTGTVPVVLGIAGWEWGTNSVFLEFGKDTEQGFQTLQRYPVAQPPAPQWRDHRVIVQGASSEATRVRVVALDQSVGPNGWLAVSTPRVPQLTRMTEVVGDESTFVEWPAALVHPCARITSNHNGIAEMPRFRIAAGGEVRAIGQGWSSPDAGGQFGWLNVATTMRELPTYLRNDINRDWGSLYQVDSVAPGALSADAATHVHTETHWGTWSPGALPIPSQLPGDVPNSEDRTDLAPPETEQ